MSDDFSIKLCKLVQGHPEIYDIFNDNFHNEDAKNNAWKLISTELGVPHSKCVIKWKSLKHQFVKAKKDQNTTWYLWPTLQFLDEAADKAGPRKRKRESTSAPTRPDNAGHIDSLSPSKSPEKPPAKKVATRSKQSPSTSPVKGDANIVAPAASEQSNTPSSRLLQTPATPQKSTVKLQPAVQATLGNSAARRRSQRFGRDESAAGTPSANKTVTFLEVTNSSQNTPKKQTTEPSASAPTESPASKPQTTAARATPRGRRSASSSQNTPKKQTTEPPASAPTESPASKPQTTAARATPRGRRSARITMTETIPEQKEEITAAAPSHSPGQEPRAKQPSSQETPKKVVTEPPTLAFAEFPVSKPQHTARATPRGRRSTRVTIAETIPEETQETAAAAPSCNPGEEPKAKQPRIEGNGFGIMDEVDPLVDMKFDSALDQKFFKQLQEKFAKLQPEVVSTMKANIFAMLDKAAGN